MGDRYNIHSQLEHLQSKYIGTGHADTTKWEWVTNQHRDTYASYLVSTVSVLRKTYLLPIRNALIPIRNACIKSHFHPHPFIQGHFDMLNYFAIAENECKARVRFNLSEKMLCPCGPPPEKPEI